MLSLLRAEPQVLVAAWEFSTYPDSRVLYPLYVNRSVSDEPISISVSGGVFDFDRLSSLMVTGWKSMTLEEAFASEEYLSLKLSPPDGKYFNLSELRLAIVDDSSQRQFMEFGYRADKESKFRKIITKVEYTARGENARCIVTNLEGEAHELYSKEYCARGDMENRIKEQQLGLFADRTSTSKWWSNQLRLLLSTFAYVLMDRLRTDALKGTEWVTKQCTTLQVKLIKIGAVITRNTRRIRIHLSSSYPHQDIFQTAYQNIMSG